MIIPSEIKKILSDIKNKAENDSLEIFVVGGFLRDLMLKEDLFSRRKIDIDFAVNGDILKFTDSLASFFSSKCVKLKKDFKTFRMIVNGKNALYQLDFTCFKGKTIFDDLACRDFTINAFAAGIDEIILDLNLADFKKTVKSLPDAFKHLKKKELTVLSKKAFEDDPLRILRCFSIAAYLDFSISCQTLTWAEETKDLLKGVAGERIKEEIFRLFSADNSYKYLTMMEKHKIFDFVFPELDKARGLQQGPYHKWDVLLHSIKSVEKYESFVPEIIKYPYLGKRLKSYLFDFFPDNKNLNSLIKFALLYHDVGKPVSMLVEKEKIKFWGHEKTSAEIVSKVCKKLKFSNVQRKITESLVYHHLRPGNLIPEEVTKKAVYRFFRQVSDNVPGLILLSIADKYATAGQKVDEESMRTHKEVLLRMLEEYFKIQEETTPENLVNGNDVMNILNIKPSVKIGKILEEIKLLQMEGKITSKNQAEKFIKTYKEDN